jgi:hypothetical protein
MDATGTPRRSSRPARLELLEVGFFLFMCFFFQYYTCTNDYLKVDNASAPNPPRLVQQSTNGRHQRGTQRRMGSRCVSSPGVLSFVLFFIITNLYLQ